MSDALLLLGATTANLIGLAWLALAMEVHWEQAFGARLLSRTTTLTLRWLGAAGLAISLALCLAVDHATMAVLVWFMTLAGSAMAIAFTLAWKPRQLGLIAPWVARSAA